jgi:hypothetical protein
MCPARLKVAKLAAKAVALVMIFTKNYYLGEVLVVVFVVVSGQQLTSKIFFHFSPNTQPNRR